MAVLIERTNPRPGRPEEPVPDARGRYQLANPKFGKDRHKVEHAIFVDSLDKAADLILKKGFLIRMGAEGKRASLISPKSLRITA